MRNSLVTLWLACVGCTTTRASEQIPLMAVTLSAPERGIVQLEVGDDRLPDMLAAQRPERVVTNNVRELIFNRVEVELARQGYSVGDTGPVMKVSLLDFWWTWRRIDFTDFEAKAAIRLQFAGTRTELIVGRAQVIERGHQALAAVADQLERALDDALRKLNVAELQLERAPVTKLPVSPPEADRTGPRRSAAEALTRSLRSQSTASATQ